MAKFSLSMLRDLALIYIQKFLVWFIPLLVFSFLFDLVSDETFLKIIGALAICIFIFKSGQRIHKELLKLKIDGFLNYLVTFISTGFVVDFLQLFLSFFWPVSILSLVFIFMFGIIITPINDVKDEPGRNQLSIFIWICFNVLLYFFIKTHPNIYSTVQHHLN